MVILHFLKERTQLIRHFYDTASAPMLRTKSIIDVGEPPFDDPPYDDSGEPPFLSEWLQADVELELIGRACVSMLSEALKQFFVNWERALWSEPPCQKRFPKPFTNGFLAGYMACLAESVAIDWDKCPADLGVVEQVILARNLSQHGNLVLTQITHDDNTREKFARPFFIQPDEVTLDDGENSFLGPRLHISRDKLFEAIVHVEQFTEWVQWCIDEHLDRRPASTRT